MAEAVQVTPAAFGSTPERRKRAMLSRAFSRYPRCLTAVSVAYFSLVGLAARVGLALLLEGQVFGVTTYQAELSAGGAHPCRLRSSGSGYFVQNILGCMLMAAVARHKTHMNEHLAVGLASGLCGSLTTFATWMGEEATTILNGYTFEAFVSLLCMLCVSMCSYRFGHFLAGCGMGDEPRCFDDFCGLRTVAACCMRRARSAKDASAAQDVARPGLYSRNPCHHNPDPELSTPQLLESLVLASFARVTQSPDIQQLASMKQEEKSDTVLVEHHRIRAFAGVGCA